MRIAITDANIFIDLHALGCLGLLKNLDLEIHTTDLVISELSDEQKDAVREIVSVVASISLDFLGDVEHIGVPKGLSVPDRSLIWYSQNASLENMLILSADNLVRKWCKANNVDVYGILWILDISVEKSLLQYEEAYTLLKQLRKINQWLPYRECEERLEKWGNQSD